MTNEDRALLEKLDRYLTEDEDDISTAPVYIDANSERLAGVLLESLSEEPEE